ncbi:MAG TPA: hypothetical protein VK168_04485 [Saprospiraceae bacterium]|nr:hypothetical protein [Saprospiraceae bacterium]
MANIMPLEIFLKQFMVKKNKLGNLEGCGWDFFDFKLLIFNKLLILEGIVFCLRFGKWV